jgi:hypothetical protein
MHLHECQALRDAMERAERDIHVLLWSNSKHSAAAAGAGLSSLREYKRIMEDVYGGLSNAPPRYVLEQQALLLQLSHRMGILRK